MERLRLQRPRQGRERQGKVRLAVPLAVWLAVQPEPSPPDPAGAGMSRRLWGRELLLLLLLPHVERLLPPVLLPVPGLGQERQAGRRGRPQSRS